MLETVHHQELRLALVAFRTSPVSSLYVDANEPSLWLRREKLSLQYAIRLPASISNPAFEVTFPPRFQEYYERKPNPIKSFGLRITPLKIGLGGSVGCAVRLETRRSRVQPPPRSATFFRGD